MKKRIPPENKKREALGHKTTLIFCDVAILSGGEGLEASSVRPSPMSPNCGAAWEPQGPEATGPIPEGSIAALSNSTPMSSAVMILKWRLG